GDGRGNAGEGIWGGGDDSRVSGDGGGNGGVSATAYLAMSASVDAIIGVWGWTDISALRSLGDLGGVGADSSVSNASVSSAKGTGSIADNVVESAGATPRPPHYPHHHHHHHYLLCQQDTQQDPP
ncbi:hypothetical protein Tco_0669059, partial [Tanacetum coccineum]